MSGSVPPVDPEPPGPPSTVVRPGSPPRFSGGGPAGGLARAAGINILMVLLSRVTGFFRGTLLAYYFGQNRLTDAYQYAFTIPDALWMLVAGGVMYAGFIPVISEYFTKDDEEGAWQTFSIIFNFLAITLSIVLVLMWLFPEPLLRHVFAPNLLPKGQPDAVIVRLRGGDQLVHPMQTTIHLTRILIPCQLCFFLGSLMIGCQNARQRFLIPAIAPVIYNVGIILGGVLLHHRLGIAGFAWGALAGAFIGNFFLQLIGLQTIRPRYSLSLNLRHPGVRKCGRLVLPVLLGISLPTVDTFVNGYFVSGIPSGRSILDYTNRLMQLPLGIFGQALGIVILPTLSTLAVQKSYGEFRNMLSYGIRLALFLTTPAAILMIVLAEPLIRVIYQHGLFQASDTAAAVPTLIMYAAGVPAWSCQAVVARGFYARQNTVTPVVLGSCVTVVFVLLNWILVSFLGVPGAALATSIAATSHALLLLYVLSRQMRGLQDHGRLNRSIRRLVVSALALASAAWGVHRLLAHHLPATAAGGAVDLLASGAAGLTFYLGVQFLLGSDEARKLGDLFRRRS